MSSEQHNAPLGVLVGEALAVAQAIEEIKADKELTDEEREKKLAAIQCAEFMVGKSIDQKGEAMVMARRSMKARIAELETIVGPTVAKLKTLGNQVKSLEEYVKYLLRPLADDEGKVKCGTDVARITCSFRTKTMKCVVDEILLDPKARVLWRIEKKPNVSRIKEMIEGGAEITGARLEPVEKVRWS